jgi:hypothetical protein
MLTLEVSNGNLKNAAFAIAGCRRVGDFDKAMEEMKQANHGVWEYLDQQDKTALSQAHAVKLGITTLALKTNNPSERWVQYFYF